MRRLLGILCVAAPFVAATITASSARHDFRIAVMAIVSTAMIWLVVRMTGTSLRSAVLAFGLAVLSAAGIALVAGARDPFAVLAVAGVIAGFATVGQFLVGSRRPSSLSAARASQTSPR